MVDLVRESNEVETRLKDARTSLWRSKGRKTRELGSALLAVSLLMFLLAFLTNYLLFEITSILSLFLGMVFLFTGTESYVRSKPANMIAKSPLITLEGILGNDGSIGQAVYYYDKEGSALPPSFPSQH